MVDIAAFGWVAQGVVAQEMTGVAIKDDSLPKLDLTTERTIVMRRKILGVDENYWTTHAADLFTAKTETLQRSVGQGVSGKLSSKQKHAHAYSVEQIQEHVKKSRALARSKAGPITGLNAMCSAALTCAGSDSEASAPSNDSGEAGDDAMDGLAVAQAIPVASSRSENA